MIAAIKTRLDGLVPATFKAIEGAGRLAALERNLPDRNRVPLACVYPIQDSAGGNQVATGVVQQRVAARIGVAIFAAAQAERQGEAAVLDMEALYRAVRNRLVGWMPPDSGDENFLGPVLLASGQMAGMDGGLALWLEQYSIDTLLRRTS